MQSKCSCISAGIVRILSMNADKNPDPPSSPSEGSISNEEEKEVDDREGQLQAVRVAVVMVVRCSVVVEHDLIPIVAQEH